MLFFFISRIICYFVGVFNFSKEEEEKVSEIKATEQKTKYALIFIFYVEKTTTTKNRTHTTTLNSV